MLHEFVRAQLRIASDGTSTTEKPINEFTENLWETRFEVPGPESGTDFRNNANARNLIIPC